MNRRQANHYSLSTRFCEPLTTQETDVVSIVYQFHPSLIYLQEQSSGVFQWRLDSGTKSFEVSGMTSQSMEYGKMMNQNMVLFQLLFHFIKLQYQISRRP